MRKTILVGSILAGFLLLMIPCVNSIEIQNQKSLLISEIKAIDYTSVVKMMKQMAKKDGEVFYKKLNFNYSVFCDNLDYFFWLWLWHYNNIYVAGVYFLIALIFLCPWAINFLHMNLGKPYMNNITNIPCSCGAST